MARIWQLDPNIVGQKFLVVRRDGTVPHWPHFVLGARDPYAPETLRWYVEVARAKGCTDTEYLNSICELADLFEQYRAEHGNGDPEAGPHRTDNQSVINVMQGLSAHIHIIPDDANEPKGG